MPPQAWPQVMRTPVELTGIAEDSRARPDFGLYEFQTDDGVWVRLHDMRFLGFDYIVQPATLTMRFLYDDPKWTPPEASATPVAVFQFTDVLVWQWEDDYAPRFETPQDDPCPRVGRSGTGPASDARASHWPWPPQIS